MKHLLGASALCLASFTLPAAAFDPAAMSTAEKEAFRAEVRAYLMENPEVIIEAVNQLEARQQAEQAAADDTLVEVNLDALHNDGFSWVGGNPEGDVTVVEFVDYRCGYCRKAYDEVAELLSSDGNIRLIVKEFPILGEASLASSQFAIAVKQLNGGDAYKSAHDALIRYSGDLGEAGVTRLAEGLGLDGAAIWERMQSDEVRAEIEEVRALAQRLKVRGTPTFVMGDELVRGYVPLAGMQQIIADQRG